MDRERYIRIGTQLYKLVQRALSSFVFSIDNRVLTNGTDNVNRFIPTESINAVTNSFLLAIMAVVNFAHGFLFAKIVQKNLIPFQYREICGTKVKLFLRSLTWCATPDCEPI